MSAVINTDMGDIRYSDDFLASIAGVAATECYGVVGMTSKKVWDSVADLLGRDNLQKGVVITSDGKTPNIKIQLFIVVQFGISINAIGNSIIHTVKYNVEQFTGLNVTDVNVVVSGIRVQD